MLSCRSSAESFKSSQPALSPKTLCRNIASDSWRTFPACRVSSSRLAILRVNPSLRSICSINRSPPSLLMSPPLKSASTLRPFTLENPTSLRYFYHEISGLGPTRAGLPEELAFFFTDRMAVNKIKHRRIRIGNARPLLKHERNS